MTRISFDVDGRIDLIDRDPPANQSDTDKARSRKSRLNDVMIAMERYHQDLQLRLRQRFESKLSDCQIGEVALTLHHTAPEFRISCDAELDSAGDGHLPRQQRAILETEIAAALAEAISEYASKSPNQRWQPAVTAAYRIPPPREHRENRRSVWLIGLLGLLVCVVFGVAYLYFNRTAP